MRKLFNMSAVYAGPEEMRRIQKEYEATAVYACPMEIEEEKAEIIEKAEVIEDKPYPLNHADSKAIFEGVYASPNIMNSDPVTSMVYASPAYNNQDINKIDMNNNMADNSFIASMSDNSFFNNEASKGKVKCIKCGNENPDNAKFCIECGAELYSYCQCGAKLESNMKFCPECGKKREDI